MSAGAVGFEGGMAGAHAQVEAWRKSRAIAEGAKERADMEAALTKAGVGSSYGILGAFMSDDSSLRGRIKNAAGLAGLGDITHLSEDEVKGLVKSGDSKYINDMFYAVQTGRDEQGNKIKKEELDKMRDAFRARKGDKPGDAAQRLADAAWENHIRNSNEGDAIRKANDYMGAAAGDDFMSRFRHATGAERTRLYKQASLRKALADTGHADVVSDLMEKSKSKDFSIDEYIDSMGLGKEEADELRDKYNENTKELGLNTERGVIDYLKDLLAAVSHMANNKAEIESVR
jgi:hypothetical protein